MKYYELTSPVSLIMKLDEHVKKFKEEPVTLIMNGNSKIDFVNSMGIFDVLRAYSQFVDLSIEVRFPIDFLYLAATCGLPRHKVSFSSSAFIIFSKPAISIYGTATDLKISTKAFEGMLERNYEVIAVALDKDTDDVEEWVCEGKLISGADKLREYGYKILGDSL